MSKPGKSPSAKTGPSALGKAMNSLSNAGSSFKATFETDEDLRADTLGQLSAAYSYLVDKMRDRAVTAEKVQIYNTKVREYNDYVDEYFKCKVADLYGIQQLYDEVSSWRLTMANRSVTDGLLQDGEFAYRHNAVLKTTADPKRLEEKVLAVPQTTAGSGLSTAPSGFSTTAPSASSAAPFTSYHHNVLDRWPGPEPAPSYNPVPRSAQYLPVSPSAMPAVQSPAQGHPLSGSASATYSSYSTTTRPVDTTSLRSMQSAGSGSSHNSGGADSFNTFGASAEDDRGSDESRGNHWYGTPRESFDSQQHAAYFSRSAQPSVYANSQLGRSSASLLAGYPGGLPQQGMGYMQSPQTQAGHANPRSADWYQLNPQGASLYAGPPPHGGQPAHYGHHPHFAQQTVPAPQTTHASPSQNPQLVGSGQATSPAGRLWPQVPMINPLAGAQPRSSQGGAANPSAHGDQPSSSSQSSQRNFPTYSNNINRGMR